MEKMDLTPDGAGYKNDYVDKMPRDSKITRVSRTIGKNRVVDELIMRFMHNIEIKSMLPEIKPADKDVVVVMKLE